MFENILDYYRTGELHFGGHICVGNIKKELEFWRIPNTALDECCWLRFKDEMTGTKKRMGLKDLVDEAKVAQNSAVNRLRGMPPHDENHISTKV